MGTLIRSGQYRSRFIFVTKLDFTSTHLQLLWSLLTVFALLPLKDQRGKSKNNKIKLNDSCVRLVGITDLWERNCYHLVMGRKILPCFPLKLRGLPSADRHSQQPESTASFWNETNVAQALYLSALYLTCQMVQKVTTRSLVTRGLYFLTFSHLQSTEKLIELGTSMRTSQNTTVRTNNHFFPPPSIILFILPYTKLHCGWTKFLLFFSFLFPSRINFHIN